MKPYQLQIGDRFQVADSCNPDELAHIYTVCDVDIRKSTIAGRDFVTGVTMKVHVDNDPSVVPLNIGPWVEVMKL